MTRQPCIALTKAQRACRAPAIPGKAFCLWHSPDPADVAKARAMSRRGAAASHHKPTPAPEVEPIASVLDLAALDLETAGGLRALLAGTMRQLARLPFTIGIANGLAQIATAQRALIETSTIEDRLAQIEQAMAARGQGTP